MDSTKRLTLKDEEALFARLAKEKWVCVFDFDGTLAAIHPDPMAVELSPMVRMSLKRISRRIPVWVVTGRALRHIVRKLPRGIPVIGEHGGTSTLSDYMLTGYELDFENPKRWRQAVQGHLKREGLLEQAWVEPKDHSITVHYRHVKDSRSFLKKLQDWIAAIPAEQRPGILPGKKVVNLLPSPSPTKGDAMRWILGRLEKGTRVLFVGDEPTDEYAFRVLRRGKHVTLFLGRGKTSAKYRLPSQAAFESFMKRFAERISED